MPVTRKHASQKILPVPRFRSILLVDDNANGLKARKMVLEELGYKIVTACNGQRCAGSSSRRTLSTWW